ncbi:MAG: inositol monophosphatase [Acetobacteraceae bacterium]|nr:inositol monophosphatase [Acetobacteraceae bacterium]
MSLRAAEIEAVAELLREAARREILPRFRRLAAHDVRAKSNPMDLVTEADEAAERVITAGLRGLFGGAGIVGEEAAAADPAILGRLAQPGLAFVVDPVDGTANFAAGIPLFGVMCAAIRNGETVAAWIHDPLGDDTLVAVKGEGAWVLTPDRARRRCAVAAPVPVARMQGAVSWGYMAPELKARVLPRLAAFGGLVNYRCAAQEYRLVATGHAHLLVYNRLLPWDHAAGVLIHAEAGGHAAQPDGRRYSPLVHQGGLICAPDEASWQAVRETLFDA